MIDPLEPKEVVWEADLPIILTEEDIDAVANCKESKSRRRRDGSVEFKLLWFELGETVRWNPSIF